MKIDERAFRDAAAMLTPANRMQFQDLLKAYLAALPHKPSIEGGVRVRVPVLVRHDGYWSSFGRASLTDEHMIKRAMSAYYASQRPLVQTRWLVATVPPYAPPAEPVVEGSVEVVGP